VAGSEKGSERQMKRKFADAIAKDVKALDKMEKKQKTLKHKLQDIQEELKQVKEEIQDARKNVYETLGIQNYVDILAVSEGVTQLFNQVYLVDFLFSSNEGDDVAKHRRALLDCYAHLTSQEFRYALKFVVKHYFQCDDTHKWRFKRDWKTTDEHFQTELQTLQEKVPGLWIKKDDTQKEYTIVVLRNPLALSSHIETNDLEFETFFLEISTSSGSPLFKLPKSKRLELLKTVALKKG
jgi:hypothetical protein